MTDVIYPTAPLAGDEFHQKYGFNNIKSDFAETLGAMGRKTWDQGFVMNELSKHIIDYDEAHNKPAADKFINSYNTLMDQYNMILKQSDHPVAKVVGGIAGFVSQPTVAIAGAGMSAFIGVESAGFMANLAESRLLSIGARTITTTAEGAAVTAPEAISHAYLAQTTPIHDTYRYLDSLREIGLNALIAGTIHLGVIEPVGGIIKGVKGKYVPPVQVATTDSMRKSYGKVQENLMNEEAPNARAELHQGFNDQRNSLKDPTVEEVRENAVKIQDRINKVDEKIKNLQKEAKEPVEPTRTLSADEIANRRTRIEAKPEEIRTPLEKQLLERLPRTEVIERLNRAMPKAEREITPEEDKLLEDLRKSPQESINSERKLMEERQGELQKEIDEKTEQVNRFKKVGKAERVKELKAEIEKAQTKLKEFKERAESFERPTTEHNEAVLKQVDKLEDERAELSDKLDNHRTALEVLNKPKTAVDPIESETKPLFYSDTDSVAEEAKGITPEDEISGIPEGTDIEKADFSDKGKEDLKAVQEEIDDLPNYGKLVDGIIKCIINVFYTA